MSAVTGIESLIQLRMSGQRPKHGVFLMVGDFAGKRWGVNQCGSCDLLMKNPTATADLRALVGLEVTVMSDHYTPAVLSVWGAVKAERPRFASLHIADWSDDPSSILLWSPKHGDQTLSDHAKP